MDTFKRMLTAAGMFLPLQQVMAEEAQEQAAKDRTTGQCIHNTTTVSGKRQGRRRAPSVSVAPRTHNEGPWLKAHSFSSWPWRSLSMQPKISIARVQPIPCSYRSHIIQMTMQRRMPRTVQSRMQGRCMRTCLASCRQLDVMLFHACLITVTLYTVTTPEYDVSCVACDGPTSLGSMPSWNNC